MIKNFITKGIQTTKTLVKNIHDTIFSKKIKTEIINELTTNPDTYSTNNEILKRGYEIYSKLHQLKKSDIIRLFIVSTSYA